MSLTRRLASVAAALSVVLVAGGCTSTPPGPRAASGASSTAPSMSRSPTTTATSPSPGATPTATARPARPPNPVSLPALMQKRYDGRDLRVVRVLARTDAYTRYAASYRSGRLTISGVLLVPRGRGPFPVLVLCHGYIDPAVYTSGQGLAREQDYLARRGYVVLHTDYRNYAGSDKDPANDVRLRLGYPEDVINAVLAVKGSSLPSLDRRRIGLLGRSMGGGVVLDVLVVKPGLVDAAVVFAPVSSNAVDNFDRWIRPDPARRGLAARIIAAYGSPERNPAFWRDVSAVTFFDRVTEPVLVLHGTADTTCPPVWSRRTVAALRGAGKAVTLLTYPGEQHAFGPAWSTSMRRAVAFFAAHLHR